MYGVGQGMEDVVVKGKSSEKMALGMQGAMEQVCCAAFFQKFARDRWRVFWVGRGGVALNGGQELQLKIARGNSTVLVLAKPDSRGSQALTEEQTLTLRYLDFSSLRNDSGAIPRSFLPEQGEGVDEFREMVEAPRGEEPITVLLDMMMKTTTKHTPNLSST